LRLSGSKKDIDELKETYNSGRAPDVTKYDPHAVTGLLKQFFRELTEPLVPHHLNQTITKIVGIEFVFFFFLFLKFLNFKSLIFILIS